MAQPLRDADGELTRLGSRLRIAALIAAILSVLLLVGIGPLAFMAGASCGGGTCTDARVLVLTLLMAAPFLWLVSAISGMIAFRHPSWRTTLLTFVPFVAAAILLGMAAA